MFPLSKALIPKDIESPLDVQSHCFRNSPCGHQIIRDLHNCAYSQLETRFGAGGGVREEQSSTPQWEASDGVCLHLSHIFN